MTYNEIHEVLGVERDDYDYKVEYSQVRGGHPSPRSRTAAGTWPLRLTSSTITPTMPTASSAARWMRASGVRLAFVEKDGAVIELYEDKN